MAKTTSANPRQARPGEARLAVNLPLKIHRLLKARAAAEGQSMRDYILALLKEQGIG